MSALHRHVGIDTPVKQMARLYELADGLFLASAVSFYCSSDLPFDGILISILIEFCFFGCCPCLSVLCYCKLLFRITAVNFQSRSIFDL